MRKLIIALSICFGAAVPAAAQMSLSFSVPGVSIGINVPMYPELVRVPGYPVYYAPGLQSNYFFYDGLYWVFQGDNWYASNWYNGPWGQVGPTAVPSYMLRLPVRYYRSPPPYFRGWRADAPPHWGEHWGPAWQQRREGWDRWDRKAVPAPAPRPSYQRQYSGDRYPQAPQQQQYLREQNYRHEPRDEAVRQHYQMPMPQMPRQDQPPQRGNGAQGRDQGQGQGQGQGKSQKPDQGKDRGNDDNRGRDNKN